MFPSTLGVRLHHERSTQQQHPRPVRPLSRSPKIITSSLSPVRTYCYLVSYHPKSNTETLPPGIKQNKGLMHWQHPRFFAYFPTASTFEAILGDLYANGIGCNPGFNVSPFSILSCHPHSFVLTLILTSSSSDTGVPLAMTDSGPSAQHAQNSRPW